MNLRSIRITWKPEMMVRYCNSLYPVKTILCSLFWTLLRYGGASSVCKAPNNAVRWITTLQQNYTMFTVKWTITIQQNYTFFYYVYTPSPLLPFVTYFWSMNWLPLCQKSWLPVCQMSTVMFKMRGPYLIFKWIFCCLSVCLIFVLCCENCVMEMVIRSTNKKYQFKVTLLLPVMESRPQSPRLRSDHPRPRPGLPRPRPPLRDRDLKKPRSSPRPNI